MLTIENSWWVQVVKQKDLILSLDSTGVGGQICSIAFPLQEKLDEFEWGPSANGEFLVKIATWIQGRSDIEA